jgi:stage IV sporulation protein B
MRCRKGLNRFFRLCRAAICGLVFTACFQVVGHTGRLSSATAAFALNKQMADVHDVYIGGQSVGIRLKSSGIMVVGFQRVNQQDSPGIAAGIKPGDIIERIDGARIKSIDGLKLWLDSHPSGDTLQLSIRRSQRLMTLSMRPVRTNRGERRLGLYVRDKTSGVGTLTFYDPQIHRYGALGHVITDADTGRPIQGKGDLYPSEVFGIVKGAAGHPGEKRGRFVRTSKLIGTIDENTAYGVYGQMNGPPPFAYRSQPVAVAAPRQVHTGTAQLLTVIQGQRVEAFTVDIENTVSQAHPSTKSMVVHVTDPNLLQHTGGIVQGMSGSPLIQDGRLVGAVTHVFVSDPTRGYGVYAAWMLHEADDGPDEETSSLNQSLQSVWARTTNQVFRHLNLSNFVVKQQSTTKSIS